MPKDKTNQTQSNKATNPPNILLVDDNVDTCKFISEFLDLHQYSYRLAHSAAQAIDHIDSATPDLILLDIQLPDMDGLTLMKVLKTHDIDVIFLSGQTEVETKIRGLELGAQDYITKPFHLKELLARINIVLNRSKAAYQRNSQSQQQSPLINIGEWQLDKKNRRLQYAENMVELTNNEYRLFSLLLNHINEDVTREQISEVVYDAQWHPNARRIDTLVYQLRNKLKQYPNGPAIKSIYNQGYTLISNS